MDILHPDFNGRLIFTEIFEWHSCHSIQFKRNFSFTFIYPIWTTSSSYTLYCISSFPLLLTIYKCTFMSHFSFSLHLVFCFTIIFILYFLRSQNILLWTSHTTVKVHLFYEPIYQSRVGNFMEPKSKLCLNSPLAYEYWKYVENRI
jgi:hypothetical protein